MKNNIIIKTIISIILLLILSFLNIGNIFNYIFNIVLLIILLILTLKKKDSFFIFVLLIYSINSIGLFMNEKNDFLLLLFYIWTIYLMYSYFKYAFDLNNNKMNIIFKSIKIPNDKEYLVVKYMNGPINKANKNALVTKERESFLIKIENNDIIDEINLKFTDIESVSVNIKPYISTKDSLSNYEVDISKSFFSGKVTGDFDVHKSSKIIKSYEILIKTKKSETIKLLSFNNPNIFNI